MQALLYDMGDADVDVIPNEIIDVRTQQRHALMTGWLALSTMVDALRTCEFYFRKFPFSSKDITRADHLRNCCEMYFDRIAQFRDRLKLTLNSGKTYIPEGDFKIRAFIKAFDKAFDWQMRQRNRVHHRGRFDDAFIDQLALISLLRHSMPALEEVVPEVAIFRKASKAWVKQIRSSIDLLDQFMEGISGVIVDNLPPSDIPSAIESAQRWEKFQSKVGLSIASED